MNTNLLNNCIWVISEFRETAKLWEDGNDAAYYPLEQVIHLENCNKLVIQYPIDRYTELEYKNVKYSITGNKVFAGQLLGWVFAFYNTFVSRKLVESTSKLGTMYSEIAQHALEEDDKYTKTSLISIPLQELMGDLNFFEGLQFVSQSDGTVTYRLLLGS
jgi:hypothetical protein